MEISLNFDQIFLDDPQARWTILDKNFSEVIRANILFATEDTYLDLDEAYVVVTTSDAANWSVHHLKGNTTIYFHAGDPN